MRLRSAALLLPLTLAVVGLGACEDKPKTTTAKKDKKKTASEKAAELNPKLAAAISSNKPAGGKPGSGPPPNGIFEKAAADKVMKLGAPASVEIGDPGSKQKITFAATNMPPKKAKGSFLLQVRSGPQGGMPNVDAQVSITANDKGGDKKAKKAAGGEKKGAGEGKKSPTGPQSWKLFFDASPLAKDQPGTVPDNVKKILEKLKGSQVTYTMHPSGSISEIKPTLSKGAPEVLKELLNAYALTQPFNHVVFPKKPVGTGGYWIVNTRHNFQKADLLSYHLYRLTSIDGDQATLSLEINQYLADKSFADQVKGLPPGAKLAQFIGKGKGTLIVDKNSSLVRSSVFQYQRYLVFKLPNNPQPVPAGAGYQGSFRMAAAKGKDKKKKKPAAKGK